MTDPKPTLPDADLSAQQGVPNPPSGQPPKIRPEHPRDQQLHDAGLELQGYLAGWASKYSLSVYEYLHVLSVAQFRQIQGLCLEERAALARRTQIKRPEKPTAGPPAAPEQAAPQPLMDPAPQEAPAG